MHGRETSKRASTMSIGRPSRLLDTVTYLLVRAGKSHDQETRLCNATVCDPVEGRPSFDDAN